MNQQPPQPPDENSGRPTGWRSNAFRAAVTALLALFLLSVGWHLTGRNVPVVGLHPFPFGDKSKSASVDVYGLISEEVRRAHNQDFDYLNIVDTDCRYDRETGNGMVVSCDYEGWSMENGNHLDGTYEALVILMYPIELIESANDFEVIPDYIGAGWDGY